jgi:hypothetical protein
MRLVAFLGVWAVLAGINAAKAQQQMPAPIAEQTDCNAASLLPREVYLCQVPVFRDAQDIFLGAYQRALRSTPSRLPLRQEQAQWQDLVFRAQVTPVAFTDFRVAYAARTREVERTMSVTVEALATQYSLDDLRESCVIPPPPGLEPYLLTCSLEKVDVLEGGRFAYQLQSWASPPVADRVKRQFQSATVVLERNSNTTDNETGQNWRLVAWATSDDTTTAEPVYIRGHGSELLHIPVTSKGSGGANEDVVFMRVESDGRWQDIDVSGWQNEVDSRMPPDLVAQPSYHLDMANLLATTTASRPEDARCCATGGIVIVELAIRDEQLVVDRVEVRPMP